MAEKRRVGARPIGSKDGIATTTMVGMVALKRGLALLREFLGSKPLTLSSNKFIRSPGVWKSARDHIIHIAGLLGALTSLQFTRQGRDLALAASRGIDLVRPTDRAKRRGQTGLLNFLASIFTSPLRVEMHPLQQWLGDARTPSRLPT